MIDAALRLRRGGFTLDAMLHLPVEGVSAVIGHSGCGKSTLVHTMAGLLKADAGHLRIAGRTLFDARTDVPPHRRALGVVFQDGRLFPHLNVRHNLEYGGRHAGDRPGPAFDDVVDLLGLGALLTRRPHTLSGGERQRVAIGRALLSRPSALLMDEPLASLDPPRRRELLEYLAALPRRYGLPLVYVTHQIDEVLRLADQLVVMSEGRTVAAGPALALLSDFALQPLIGPAEAASVLEGRIAQQWPDWQLTRVDVAGQAITVPQIDAPLGTPLRLRLRARDVTLQREAHASSAANQVHGTVLQCLDREGPYAAIELALSPTAADGERLWALVTRRSAHTLAVRAGETLVASFKAVAVETRSRT